MIPTKETHAAEALIELASHPNLRSLNLLTRLIDPEGTPEEQHRDKHVLATAASKETECHLATYGMDQKLSHQPDHQHIILTLSLLSALVVEDEMINVLPMVATDTLHDLIMQTWHFHHAQPYTFNTYEVEEKLMALRAAGSGLLHGKGMFLRLLTVIDKHNSKEETQSETMIGWHKRLYYHVIASGTLGSAEKIDVYRRAFATLRTLID